MLKKRNFIKRSNSPARAQTALNDLIASSACVALQFVAVFYVFGLL